MICWLKKMELIQNAHSKTIEKVLEELKTDKYGLTEKEAKNRLAVFGPNELEKGKGRGPLSIFIHQFLNPLVGILIVAALIVLIADQFDEESHIMDVYVIIGVIMINAVFGFIQEFKAEKSIEALKKMGAPEATVLRKLSNEQYREFEIPAAELVPGDIIIISTGDRIPADARLVEEMNLHCDEAMLTGESVPSSKNLNVYDEDAPVGDRKNLIFGGTLAVQGRGKAVIVATGMKTEMGKIASLIKETETKEIPIKRRINKLTKTLATLALVTSLIVFLVAVLEMGTSYIFYAFLLALATSVSSIPEGLPIVVTVTLAVAVNRMAKRNAIMRKMQAIDTLGAVSAIVSDKTGTLTTNQMTVKKLWVNSGLVDIEGTSFEPIGRFLINDSEINPKESSEIVKCLETMVLCNDATLRDHKGEDGEFWKIFGDPTEGALVVLAAKAQIIKEKLELDYPRVDEIAFDSAHKYMATFHQSKDSSKVLVCVKGAPEKILSMSSALFTNEGTKSLNDTFKQNFLDQATKFAKQALRVLGFAFLEVSENHDKIKSEFPEITKLTFLGLIGMIDPPRPEVKESIRLCKRAGIDVFMATGDHKLTGFAIAKELGIAKENELVLTGPELQNMSQEELETKVLDCHVFARVTPEHKHRVVLALQKHGKVVAVTGDGINDAPALKAAEVGVAMGITGTDVTKETAEVVLVDDNFASIVNAVEEGRVVFENIRKVVKYLVSTNMATVVTIIAVLLLFPIIFPTFFGIDPTPEKLVIFTAIQILWVNLVTDGPLDITIAVEPKEEDVMERKPHSPDENIINKEILQNMAVVSVCMSVGTIIIYLLYLKFGSIEKAKTAAFICLIYFQIFNALNCRSRSRSVFELGFFKNRAIIGAIIFSVIATYLATEIPLLQFILDTVHLEPLDWLVIIIVTSSVWGIEELRKFYQFRWVPKKTIA